MDKITDEGALRDILVNVRKSYRLLFFFQDRIKNVVKFIGDYLGAGECTGWSYFGEKPPPMPRGGDKSPLERWAWDWLGMYRYSFDFGTSLPMRAPGMDSIEQALFSIVLVSDTGCFDAGFDADNDEDRLRVERYKPVDESESKLLFIVAKEENPLEYPHAQLSKSSKHEEATKYYDKSEEGILRVIAKAYDLAKFIDEDAITTQIEDFKRYVKEKSGIEIAPSTS